MITVRDIKLVPGQGESVLREKAAKKLHIRKSEISSLRILRRSIDARDKNAVKTVYTVEVSLCSGGAAHGKTGAKPEYIPPERSSYKGESPVIIGFGPAGMFAALILAGAGMNPIVLERGGDVDTRANAVSSFWNGGSLAPDCNVQFGEGGAGTFSDGKLTTGINDCRTGYVLRTLRHFGAPENILYDAKPHIGTDLLRTVVKNLRREVISLGGEVRFMSKVTDFNIKDNVLKSVTVNGSETVKCPAAILAAGHSARDTFERLLALGIPMEPKPFSMGVRIEHLQSDISFAQYGKYCSSLPPADYKLNVKLPNGGSAYTFCMSPGGYVIAAASETGAVCTNGMSLSKRDGVNANSAVLVTLTPDMFPDKSVLGGMYWQRDLEKRAFIAGGGNYYAPAQLVGDFLAKKTTKEAGKVIPTYRPGVTWSSLDDVLPPVISQTLRLAIPEFGKRLRGFDDPEAVLTAPETRSSSPVRVLRNGGMMSAAEALFPAGEGAGYAGGIVSAAVDGIRSAEAVIKYLL